MLTKKALAGLALIITAKRYIVYPPPLQRPGEMYTRPVTPLRLAGAAKLFVNMSEVTPA